MQGGLNGWQFDTTNLYPLTIDNYLATADSIVKYVTPTQLSDGLGGVVITEADPTVDAYTKGLTSASELLTEVKTVDGTGSGLDADLWDSYQFSDYLDQGVKTTDNPTFIKGYFGSGESRFWTGTYVDPRPGYTHAIKIGAGGISVNGDSYFNNNLYATRFMGGVYPAYYGNYLDLSAWSSFPQIAFGFASGSKFNIQEESQSAWGGAGVVMQAFPSTSTKSFAIEAWSANGLYLGTGNAKEIGFFINRAGVAKFAGTTGNFLLNTTIDNEIDELQVEGNILVDTLKIGDQSTKIYNNGSGDIVIEDTNTGAKTLAELASGGGGGASLIDLVGYQEGGWSADNSSSSLGVWGIMEKAVSMDNTSSLVTTSLTGRAVLQIPNGISGFVVCTYSDNYMYLAWEPVFSIKFRSNTTTNTRLKVGMSSMYMDFEDSDQNNVCLVSGASGNYKFYTSNGSSYTETDSGIARTTNTLIFIVEVSDSEIKMYLYDADYELLASATHTTSLPSISSGMYLTSTSIDTGGSTSNSIEQYSAKIIIKR